MRDVAFSCDNNGVPFLKVAVGSLLSHYRGTEPLRVNVFEGYGGHSAESKAALGKIIDGFNKVKVRGEGEQWNVRSSDFSIDADISSASNGNQSSTVDLDLQPRPHFSLRYVNVEETLKPYEDAILHRDNSRWNVFTWTPVFTPALLPDATGNVIHFDIDMLFNADVSELFKMEWERLPSCGCSSVNCTDAGESAFHGNAPTGEGRAFHGNAPTGEGRAFHGNAPTGRPFLIACTYEYDKYGENAGRVVWEKGILPPTVERYFNTGVLVFNVEACRAERTWEKIVDWYRAHYDIADRIEQDAWNALYWDRMRPLDVAWNFHDRAMKNYAKWDLSAKYWLGNPPADCLRAALAPKLLHFWGPKKPWKVSHRPYRKLYHAAMRAVGLTPPPEPFLAPWHDFANARIARRIRKRLNQVTVTDSPAETQGH